MTGNTTRKTVALITVGCVVPTLCVALGWAAYHYNMEIFTACLAALTGVLGLVVGYYFREELGS